jgi:hypothetical protein
LNIILINRFKLAQIKSQRSVGFKALWSKVLHKLHENKFKKEYSRTRNGK